jgi:hypothetical protein
MKDDVVGLSGHGRPVESLEHVAGLQIGREGPSAEPARPGVENDREVEKAGQRRQEGYVVLYGWAVRSSLFPEKHLLPASLGAG